MPDDLRKHGASGGLVSLVGLVDISGSLLGHGDLGRCAEKRGSEVNDIVKRLRDADRDSVQRALGSRIFGEAADRIRALEAALREAKTQIYSPNSPTHALIEKLLGSGMETGTKP
jgi:hypothetical protein